MSSMTAIDWVTLPFEGGTASRDQLTDLTGPLSRKLSCPCSIISAWSPVLSVKPASDEQNRDRRGPGLGQGGTRLIYIVVISVAAFVRTQQAADRL